MTDEVLTREAEAIERSALAALHAAMGGELRESLRLALEEVGDALVSVAGALPTTAITINRSLGLGSSVPPSAEEVMRIKALYGVAGLARYFVQPDPAIAENAVAPLFEAAGLERARGWQKFARGRDVPDVETEVVIRETGPEDGSAFAEIVCDASDLGEEARPWIARLPIASGWRAFVGLADGRPIGAGGLFVDGDVAYTDFGATAAPFRGRGAQLSNLAHRIRAGLETGARRIHTCTGVAIPGEPQHSYGNIRRCGFSETHLQHTWAPPRT